MQDREKRRLEEMLDTEMTKLRKLVEGYVEGSSGIAEMEKGLLTGALGLCLVLLKFIISVKGAEDLSDQLVCGEEETIKMCASSFPLALPAQLCFQAALARVAHTKVAAASGAFSS
jgi:hypothetical protein